MRTITVSPALRSCLAVANSLDDVVAFDGVGIKIGAGTLARWRASYRHIRDWPAALQAIDDFCAANPGDNLRQISRASSWLERRNAENWETSDEAIRLRGRSF